MTTRTRTALVVLLITVFLSGSAGTPVTVWAQSDEVVLTIAVWELARDLFTPQFFASFESENPGIRVVLENTGADGNFSPAGANLEEHFEGIQNYVSAADVLQVSTDNFSVEGTRAGYFLDLVPLTSLDASLNEQDFFPAAWESFQWDGGFWAMPAAVDPILLIYNPDAFQRAGLDFPGDSWTFDDLVGAIRALAERDAEGNIVSSPILIPDPTLNALFLSLAGERLYDDTTFPATPHIAQPGLEAMLETWAELNDEGLVGETPTTAIEDIPMLVVRSIVLPQLAALGGEPGASLMPGGQSALTVLGFAVSAGTDHPEEAYALVKWLSRQPDVVERLLGAVPARQSLLGLEGDDEPPFVLPAATPEQQALVIRAVETGMPFSELRFHDYLTEARNSVTDDGVAPQVALQDAEVLAIENLRAAADRRDEIIVNVATPLPLVDAGSGKVTLTFGSQLSFGSLPNGDLWLEAFQDFAAQDPEVVQVVPDSRLDVFELQEAVDCFYLLDNGVPNLNLQGLLNLDPLIDADSSFNSSDLLPGVMAQLQKGGMTWAYPLSISPLIIRFNEERFLEAGAIPPADGWTVDAFVDALHVLKSTPDDPAPFVTLGANDYLIMLMTGFGGVPFDYSVDPPVVNLTDPSSVDAIRQVLDLAREGYIHYQPVGITGAGTIVDVEESALYPDSIGFRGVTGADDETFKIATFPTGNQFSAAVYAISSAYISASSQNPEACYRLISFLDRRAELLNEMPARRSQIDDPVLAAAQGDEAVAFFRQYATLLERPSTVIYPSTAAQSVEASLLTLWSGRAFDRYVLEDADLEVELEEAQLLSSGYLNCTVDIPAFDPARFATAIDYVREYARCAVAVDPSLQPLFSALLG